LDVDDAYRIASRLILDPAMRRRAVNIALRAYPVVDFVRILENITGKTATCKLVNKGQHYEVSCPELPLLLEELGISPRADYLEKVLRKYFPPGH
jgi:hypothetical protein